jgi:hypothetical protein
MKIPDSPSDFIHIFWGEGGGTHGQWLITSFSFFPPFAFFLAPQFGLKAKHSSLQYGKRTFFKSRIFF